MCKASHYAETVLEVEDGRLYDIDAGIFGLASLVPVGQKADDCVACAKTDAVLTLLNIPLDLQTKYGLRSREVVRFFQTDGHHQDQVLFRDGRSLGLDRFVNKDVSVYAGEIEDTGFVRAEADDGYVTGTDDTVAQSEGWGGLTKPAHTMEIVRS